MFDLDRTLTRRGTYSPFLLHAARSAAPWRLVFVPAVLVAMLAYKLGAIPRRTLKEWMQRLLLGRQMARPLVERLADSFAERIVAHGIPPEAWELLQHEREEGRVLILATAAHRFYAEAIARRLNIPHVVATESEWVAGMLLAAIDGANCRGAAKAAGLEQCIERLGLRRPDFLLRCYSDDLSDLPCFAASDDCIAVNPSRKLSRIAQVRGWRIVRFDRQKMATADGLNGGLEVRRA